MQKITLYDILSRFNNTNEQKQSFNSEQNSIYNKPNSNKQPNQDTINNNANTTSQDKLAKSTNTSTLIEPTESHLPPCYSMNNKMQSFIARHESLSKRINNNNK